MKPDLLAAAAAALSLPVRRRQAVQPTSPPARRRRRRAARAAEPPPRRRRESAIPITDQAIVVTGVKRRAGDVLGGVSVLDEAELTHEVRPSIGETLRGSPACPRPASARPRRARFCAASRGARPRTHRRHRQPRPVVVRPRPCGRDQPADRRADRGAARARGPAVRFVRDRRRGQRHRHPDSAPRADQRGRRRRASSNMAAPRTSARATSRSTCRSPGISCSMPTAIIRRPTTSKSAASSSPKHSREALASRDPRIQAFADLKGKLPKSRPHRRLCRRSRLCRRRAQYRRFGQPPRYEIWRSDPLPARSRRGGTNSRPSTRTRRATMFAPKSRCPACSARCACAAAGQIPS